MQPSLTQSKAQMDQHDETRGPVISMIPAHEKEYKQEVPYRKTTETPPKLREFLTR